MNKKRHGIGRYRSSSSSPSDGPEKLGFWEDSSNRPEEETIEPPTRTEEKPVPIPMGWKEDEDPGLVRSFLWYLYVGSLLTFSASVFFTIGYGWPLLLDHIDRLPGIEIVNDYRPDLGSQLLDCNGEPIAEFFQERRLRLARREDIPDHLIQALIATEDQQFYKHHGINPFRIAMAAYKNFTTGSLQGGSTITQQLAKDLYTDKARTYQRKIQEALYSLKIEQELSKEEILTIYLNQVDFGHSTKGIVGAAEYYFGKYPKDLTLAECATLVGLLKANTKYSPKLHPEASKRRRAVVLKLMEECGFITEEERIEASQEELVLRSKKTGKAPQLDRFSYWTSFVRDQILLRDESSGRLPLTSDHISIDRETLYSEGLRIQTTLDPQLEEWAAQALQEALIEEEKIRRKNRPGWGMKQKPKFASRIYPNATLLGQVTGFEEPNWLTVKLVDVDGQPVVAVPHPGDSDWRARFGVLTKPYYVPVKAYERTPPENATPTVLPEADLVNRGLVTRQDLRFKLIDPQRDPHAEGALVCLEVGTGRILAWAGGFDWYSEPAHGRRNRCIEPAQPGSSFKPIIYAAAFENGYSPATRISNAPFVKTLPDGRVWQPRNYTRETVGGYYTIRKSLIKSLNIPTVRVFETLVGHVYQYDPFWGEPTLEIAKRMGIKSRIPKNLSVALGTADVTPLEMATAYSVFANDGILVEPYAIEWIETRDGQREYIHLTKGQENALDPVHAYLITDILSGVVRDRAGTAYRLAHDFPFPIAGKTGTTNEYFDAWFVGYSKNLVTAVWIGHDNRRSLGSKRSGGRVALPPWLSFMEKAIPYHLEKHLGLSREEIRSVSGKPELSTGPLAFRKPDRGLVKVEVCAYSGLRPNAYCRTVTHWYPEGSEPREFCRDCGIRYKDVPVATTKPLYPSQAAVSGEAARPRPVRRLRLSPIDEPATSSTGPQLEIRNARELNLRYPVRPWAEVPSVQPAVPRPIPARPSPPGEIGR